jgi:sigma-E factor negative regulatory protein RseC
MKQTGYVIKEKGAHITVQVLRATACGDKCSGCGAGCERELINVEVPNELNASIGNQVEIESESKKVLKLAFFVYILPLVGLLIGMLGVSFTLDAMGRVQHEGLMLLGGFVLFVIGMVIVKLIDHRMNHRNEEMFKMTRII